MKTSALTIITCLAVTVSALVIPSPDRQIALVQSQDGDGSETAVAESYDILPPKAPVATARPSASAPLPMLFIDGPTTGEDDDESSAAIVVVPEEDVDEASATCFCAGGAICCRSRGETDCSFGVCGI